jgi:hypothetical protein
MKPHRLGAPQALPQTRNDLQLWVREHLELPADLEIALLEAVDAVFSRHERLWQESAGSDSGGGRILREMADGMVEQASARQQYLHVF